MTLHTHTLQSIGDIDQAIDAWQKRRKIQARIVKELEEYGMEGFVMQKALDTIHLIDKFIEDLQAIKSNHKI